MSYAALNAAGLYAACHRALAMRRQMKMDSGEHEADYDRLGRVADLASHVSSLNGDKAEVFISADDYKLFGGHWSNT
jgi:hypothetical protein